MNSQQLTKLLQQGFPQAEIDIQQDGNKFTASVVSQDFAGKTMVQRHRMVYNLLTGMFASNELHALSLTTITPEEVAARQ